MESTLYKLKNPISFDKFKNLVVNLAEAGKSSGEETTERIEATKINAQRIKRISKTFTPAISTINSLAKLKHHWDWILIIESWCGDGAQNGPIISKIAELNPLINLKIILRDENEEIMNMHLTNGTKSIPKLICIDSQTKELIGEWGPRPKAIQQMVKEYKANNPTASHEEFVKNLHLWYAKDKGVSFENEFIELIEKWNN